MEAQLRNKWLKALRSGEYEQCEGQLHIQDDGYCCLGVLARCAGYASYDIENHWIDIADLKDKELSHQLTKEDESHLIHMNDGGDDDFPAIADWIEDNVSEDSP